MSGAIGHISVFDHNSTDWQIFLSRLKQYLKLNDIKKENQSALLLTHLSDETYRLARNLVHPKNIEEVTFEELVKELSSHFTPKRCNFADRARFYEASRAGGESVEAWAARLRGLAILCDFGSELEVLLRDRFVLGMSMGPERDRLFETDAATITFNKALELAQQAACARQARAAAVPLKEEPVFRAGVSPGGAEPRRCSACGLKSHTADKCRYKKFRCQQCGERGHLKKVCSNKKNHRLLNSVSVETGSGSTSAGAQVDVEEHTCRECELYNLRISK
ncbi:uncharacterized protein LOC119694483 [Plutella xylostella]|uniref:uncharacterized protein LOC119694483 n=1 Tax=Plutella xylostella TaxID=51655 RepID=UPI002032BD92|nr:uncharacterized protein LOC119694483 [Plutella xylostella]